MTLEKAISTLKLHQSVMGEGYPLREAITVVLDQLQESDELKKVTEKYTVPKKHLISRGFGVKAFLFHSKCPSCKTHLGWFGEGLSFDYLTSYCHVCGQLLKGAEEVKE